MHVEDLSAVRNQRRDGEVPCCPDKIHRIPLRHGRLTKKLQTLDRVGSAVLVAAHLFQERQPIFPRKGIIKLSTQK